MPSILRATLALAFAGAALAGCSQNGSAVGGNALPGAQSQSRNQSPQHQTSSELHQMPGAEIYADGVSYHRVCGDVQVPGLANCNLMLRDDPASRFDGGPHPESTPGGLHPADLQSAYALNVKGGKNQLVAIVDAYDNPNLESDLAVYRAEWGLPACTTKNKCFKKVNQEGGSSYPGGDTGWGLEESLDVDMVSANCPNCKILVVEANSNSFSDLGASVTEAAKLKARVISNSYGGGEFQGEDSSSPYDAGVLVTASNGDSGYGVEFPAASSYVTAVGGTGLFKASGPRGWSETVWRGTGSGCSQYATKPSWQKDIGCTNRTVGDVSYDANPASGPVLYDTYGEHGWEIVGGTSVGSPSIAAIYALSGKAKKLHDAGASYGYAHLSGFNDITSGSNGSCSPAYLCNGEVGYDGPTGNGTPIGTTAF